MEVDEISDPYFTYDGRLASFKSTHPVARRASNAKGKAPKAVGWPHKELDPDYFARAGFYFKPTPEAPDNTVCFLCFKSLAGWEGDDNPLEEHLRLSPHCGWAIVAAIEVGLGDYVLDDPNGPQMVEARKATFGGRWPHEGKRGWKCKTKQLVDAGWKYTPTSESEDMATCTYCQLALDGWEPKDNPWDEHSRRSPDCQFFALINQYSKGPAKKKGRGKGVRASQSSRLSAQSIATTASDMPSMLDHTADHEDSVMTTTSVMTQGGTKRARAKKGTAAKGKRTRVKRDEAIEVLEDPPDVEEEAALPPPPPPPPKPARGRKRSSDAVDDSALTIAEAPAVKKRATRTQQTNASVIEQPDEEAHDESLIVPKAKGKKGRSANTRKARKVSAASTVSAATLDGDDVHMMDDEELDRQLQADLDRPLSDDEAIAADSDSDRKKVPAKAKGKKSATKKGPDTKQDERPSDHAMFDPAPPQIDETVVDTELKALEAEMEVEQDEPLQIPKKGRKAGTRKASKQTAKKAKGKEPVEAEPEPQPDVEAAAVDELAEGHDMSIVSNGTIVRTSLSSNAAPKKRGRPSKKAVAATSEAQPDELGDSDARDDLSSQVERFDFGNSAQGPDATEQKDSTPKAAVVSSPGDKSLPLPPAEVDEPQLPSTPKPIISPAPAAKQATLSPSQSPQSSNAENEPPSSKPSNTANSSRIALAPIAITPMRTSPSKRNVLAGLQSSLAWTAADVETIFEDFDKENGLESAKLMKGGEDLTSPEKQMTVEEWIYHNAEQAEHKLKHECEVMVTAFEKEGTRAMRTLECLVVE
ncbi:hypothetical protein AAE478_001959 [Parahypoxylon ruwenzoriense]